MLFLVAVFSQGDEGKSWYIIMKGSVNVVIYGKVSGNNMTINMVRKYVNSIVVTAF